MANAYIGSDDFSSTTGDDSTGQTNALNKIPSNSGGKKAGFYENPAFFNIDSIHGILLA